MSPEPGSAAWVRERMAEQDAQAEGRVTGERLAQLCEDAVEAAKWERIRVQWVREDSPEMPALGMNAQTRPIR